MESDRGSLKRVFRAGKIVYVSKLLLADIEKDVEKEHT